jgi:hypothetical protein
MSSPGPSGGTGPKKKQVKKKVTKKKKEDEEKVKKDGSATDETASNSDRREGREGREEVLPSTSAKPQSAGASMRDAAQRILTISLKGEWTAVEGIIKSLEKAVEKAKAAAEEDIYLAPLAGVLDPVSIVRARRLRQWISFRGKSED